MKKNEFIEEIKDASRMSNEVADKLKEAAEHLRNAADEIEKCVENLSEATNKIEKENETISKEINSIKESENVLCNAVDKITEDAKNDAKIVVPGELADKLEKDTANTVDTQKILGKNVVTKKRLDESVKNQYETVIGLEVHVELATKTKIFCGCTTEFGGAPNTHTCPVCTGMPGSLPVLNKQVVEYALAVGLATNCGINQYCKFDRKNYFYPDNPQNYQISQLYLPICHDGYVEIEVEADENEEVKSDIYMTENASYDRSKINNPRSEDESSKSNKAGKNAAKKFVTKRIGIHEIHMEEDAGKLIHDENGNSLVDYNRSGVPLIEIVSEPDMRSAEEVIAYLEKLRMIIQYLGASDCKLQEGSMRADVNLSVRKKGASEYGTRTEMKNMNSFKGITRAIQGEMERQILLLEAGEEVVQETRRWDDNLGTSFAMRSKEDAQDYRYFPDPDLVPLMISDVWIQKVRDNQPELRTEKMARYIAEFGLPAYDADIITGSKKLADLFEATTAICQKPKKVSNWLMVETFRLLSENAQDPEDIKYSPENLAKLINLADAGTINSTVAKEVFEKIFYENIDPDKYVEEKGLKTVNDEGELRTVIEEVIANNQKMVQDYKNGKKKAIGALVGQTMKATKGKANPGLVNQILEELLSH